MRNIINFFLVLVLILFILAGCSFKKANGEENDKIKEELNYLDWQIVSTLNELNNITLKNYTITSKEVEKEQKDETKSSNEEQNNTTSNENSIVVTQMEQRSVLEGSNSGINWDKIKSDIEIINEVWTVMVIDLANKNVDNNSILDFSNNLNKLIIFAKNEDKPATIEMLSKLYSYIPKYEEEIKSENNIQSIKKTKSYLINIYSLVEKNNWEESKKNVELMDSEFKNITSNIEYVKNNEFKVNRTYVLIKELQNALEYKDKELFLVKYSNLIESLNIL